MSNPIISARDISVEFRLDRSRDLKRDFVANVGARGASRNGRMYLQAVRNVSFDVFEGECVGLIGGNGAGKSTLLRVLAGILPVSSGKLKRPEHIRSMLSRSLGLDQNATGRENVKLMAAVQGIHRSHYKELIDDVADFSELGSYLDVPVRAYSAGMRARLSFGLITAMPSETLLVDEIIGTGDESFRKKAGERFRSIMQRSGTIVLASHSKDLLEAYATKTIWMDYGELRFMGDTKKALKLYKTEMRKRRSEANGEGKLHKLRDKVRNVSEDAVEIEDEMGN